MYSSLVNSFAYTRLLLEIRPASSDGLLLYNGQSGGGPDFIAVLLRDSVVEFRYNLGSGTAIIRGLSPLAANQWHTVEVVRNGKIGQLIVNDHIPAVGESGGGSFSLQLGGDLYVGGVPDYSQISFDIDLEVGFTGCIRLLETTPTNEPITFLEDSTGRHNVVNCPSSRSCAEDPCANNGTCQTDPLNRDIVCVCQDGFFGDTCQYTRVDCTILNPCQNGGQCRDVEYSNGTSEQLCQCYLPFGGRFCSQRE